MKEEDLKPCPFCRGQAVFEQLGTRRQSCVVECQWCGTSHGANETGSQCGTSWNTRPRETELADALRLMIKEAESYGEAWARAYAPPMRGATATSVEENFRLLGIAQDRLKEVARLAMDR